MTAERTTVGLRTPSEPMAFSPDELLRTTRNIWILFMALVVVGETVVVLAIQLATDRVTAQFATQSFAPPVDLSLIFAVGLLAVFTGMISGIASIFGILVARPIGMALRRVADLGVHVAAYALLGALIGILYLALVTGGRIVPPLDGWSTILSLPGVCAALAIPLGWWWTVRRILREDARPRPARRTIDVDSVVEDAIIDATPVVIESGAARRTLGPAIRGRMDFTSGEFWRGAVAAWVIFMIALTIVLLSVVTITAITTPEGPLGPAGIVSGLTIYLGYGLPIGGIVSALAMLLGSPIFWLTGRILARYDHVWLHLLCHALLGGTLCAIVILIGDQGTLGLSALATPFALLTIYACMASVGGGWAWGFWRSRVRRSAPG